MRFQFHEFSAGVGAPEGHFEIVDSFLTVVKPDVDKGQTFGPFITHRIKYLDGEGEEKEWGLGSPISLTDYNGRMLGLPSEDGETPAVETDDPGDPDIEWPDEFGFIYCEKPLKTREDSEYGIVLQSLLRAGFDLERFTEEGVGCLAGLKGEWGQHTYKPAKGKNAGKDVTIAIFGKLENAGGEGKGGGSKGKGSKSSAKAAPKSADAKDEAAAEDFSDDEVEKIKELVGKAMSDLNDKGQLPAPRAKVGTAFFVHVKKDKDLKSKSGPAKKKALELLDEVSADEPLDAGEVMVTVDDDGKFLIEE